MSYSWAVPIALFGFIPFSLFLFAWLRPLRGLLATFLLGYLLLPNAGYKLPGAPAYDKLTAIALSALLGAVIFDARRLAMFRPRWIDLAMLCWCIAPIASSLSNDLGFYDGLSGCVAQIFLCGIPYFLGRLYLCSAESLREFTIAFVLGGLFYVPFCLYEIRMSPQLHAMIYGFQQHSFLQTYRLGGWRPTVFLDHGLSVGLFMCSAAFAAICAWHQKMTSHLLRIPIGWAAITLFVVAVVCKSSGAIFLLVVALAVVWSSRAWRTSLPLLGLFLVVPMYIIARAASAGLGSWMVDLVATVSGDRASSLAWRVQSEEILAKHAFEQPIFGWGTWGRNLVSDYGGGPATPDARWVIYLGVNGLFGLVSWLCAMLGPVYRSFRRVSKSVLLSAAYAPVMIACSLLLLFMIDSLLNADHDPAYPLLAGGLAGLATTSRRTRGWNAAPHRASSLAPVRPPSPTPPRTARKT